MASKKEWRRRAKRAVFAQSQAESEVRLLQDQLNEVDKLLKSAQFPGPTLQEWAGQVRTFLNELANMRFPIIAMAMAPNPIFEEKRMPVPSDSGMELPTQEEIFRAT